MNRRGEVSVVYGNNAPGEVHMRFQNALVAQRSCFLPNISCGNKIWRGLEDSLAGRRTGGKEEVEFPNFLYITVVVFSSFFFQLFFFFHNTRKEECNHLAGIGGPARGKEGERRGKGRDSFPLV